MSKAETIRRCPLLREETFGKTSTDTCDDESEEKKSAMA